MRFPLVLALVAAVTELIPVIGPIIAAIPAILLARADSPTKALLVLGFYVLLQQFESNVLIPKVMEQQTHIPPLLSLFAIFAGGSIAGILGALVAVPFAGALMVIVQMVVAPAIRERFGGGNRE